MQSANRVQVVNTATVFLPHVSITISLQYKSAKFVELEMSVQCLITRTMALRPYVVYNKTQNYYQHLLRTVSEQSTEKRFRII